jgi:very-short-patch-repair endonuclease
MWSPTDRDLAAAALQEGWSGLRDHADGRHGVVHRLEALACGVSPDALRRAVRAERLVVLRPGVLAFAAPQTSWGVWRAAALTVRGALTGTTGLQAWDVLPATDEERPHVAVARGRLVARPALRVSRVRDVEPVLRRHVPVLPVERCLLDADLAVPVLDRAVNEALVLGRVTEAALSALDRRWPGHPGLRRLGLVVSRLDVGRGVSIEQAERRLRELLLSSGLTGWRTNHEIGSFTYDVAFEAAGVVVELQSFSFHRTRAAQDRDARKAVAAQAAGWALLPVTAGQLLHEQLWLVASIGQAVARGQGCPPWPAG